MTSKTTASKMKIFGLSISALIGGLLLIFLLSLAGLGYYKFFLPRTENIKREVFENTKSYVQGIQQDLGKYYHEYQLADAEGKLAIKATIRMRFAEVDTEKLQSPQLRAFLTNMRGY